MKCVHNKTKKMVKILALLPPFEDDKNDSSSPYIAAVSTTLY